MRLFTRGETMEVIANYSMTSFSNYQTMTVIDLATNGHVIYGPYLSANTWVTLGFDVCNGMFYDSIGNYAYFATSTYPYLVGCFGPENYPSFGPNCTINRPSNYTISSYARSLLNSSSTMITGSISSSSSTLPPSSTSPSSSSLFSTLTPSSTSASQMVANARTRSSSARLSFSHIILLLPSIILMFWQWADFWETFPLN